MAFRQASGDENATDRLPDVQRSSVPLPFRRTPVTPVFAKPSVHTWLVNGLLCFISLVGGGGTPVLVDMSKTAVMFIPGGSKVHVMPYSVLSLLRAEAIFNVVLGLVAILVTRPQGGLRTLFDPKIHQMMLPLTIIYCLGDASALCAIGGSGGPLYTAIASSRLLFAAALSSVLLGRRQTPLQWALLGEMSLATAVYAVLRSSHRGTHDSVDSASLGREMVGIGFAVSKAVLSGMAAVLTRQAACCRSWCRTNLVTDRSLHPW